MKFLLGNLYTDKRVSTPRLVRYAAQTPHQRWIYCHSNGTSAPTKLRLQKLVWRNRNSDAFFLFPISYPFFLLISGMRELQWVPYVAWRGQPGLNMHLQARNSSCFLDHHHPLDVSLDVVVVKDISSRTTIRCGHKASKRLKLRVKNWSKYKSWHMTKTSEGMAEWKWYKTIKKTW